MFDRCQNALRGAYYKRTVRADAPAVRNCPHCDEGINARAEQCWHCGGTLNDSADKPSAAVVATQGDAEPPSLGNTELSDESMQGAATAASVSTEKARSKSLPWSVKFGAVVFLIGLTGYFESANKIQADPFTYGVGQIGSQFNWTMFFAQYGMAISVLGIGIAVFGFILYIKNKEK